jgi:hypothetical protein
MKHNVSTQGNPARARGGNHQVTYMPQGGGSTDPNRKVESILYYNNVEKL